MDIFFKASLDYILFYAVTAMWLVEFILFPSRHKSEDFSEKRSFSIILGAVVFSIAFTLTLSYFGALRLDSKIGSAMHYAGIVVYVLGISLRYSGALYLGKYFTRDVQVSKGQELVGQGPYRVLRHPLYLGLFMLATGVPMFFSNPLGLVVTAIAVGIPINRRMVLEERTLEAALGQTYLEWKRDRYRFIPYIY